MKAGDIYFRHIQEGSFWIEDRREVIDCNDQSVMYWSIEDPPEGTCVWNDVLPKTSTLSEWNDWVKLARKE